MIMMQVDRATLSLKEEKERVNRGVAESYE